MANDVLAKMAVQISANNAQFSRALAKNQKELGSFGKSIGALSNQLKGLVAGFGAIEIGRQILRTTSEFQKFAAVLKNSLGSESEAQRAMQQIKDFASATPFSVEELTGSFVKLVNQGFHPTMDEMRKLGDLAASTGKGFDQLTEAIIDAQTGEFERLKDFGIRARKEGDKVTFTFKEQATQVDFTSGSIRDYILSLGDLQGVSGATAAISETLGGRISNLGDAWNELMGAMGESSSGPLFSAVTALTNIVKALTDFRSEMALIGQAISPFHDLSDVSKETLDYLLKTETVASTIAPLQKQSFETFYQNFTKNAEAFREAFLKQGESIEDINILWDHYVNKRVAAADADRKAADAAKLAADAAKQLAAAQEQATMARLMRGAGALRTEVGTSEDINGGAFLMDLGVFAQQAEQYANISDRIIATNNAIKVSSTNAFTQLTDMFQEHQDKVARMADLAEMLGSTLGDVFGQIATGQMNLAQTLAKTTEQIIEMLLRQSIASMITAAMKDPSTPFPLAKVAMAAAGIVAVKSLFGKIGASGSGGGGGGSVSAPGRSPSEQRVHGVISGYNLALVSDKQGYRRSMMG